MHFLQSDRFQWKCPRKMTNLSKIWFLLLRYYEYFRFICVVDIVWPGLSNNLESFSPLNLLCSQLKWRRGIHSVVMPTFREFFAGIFSGRGKIERKGGRKKIEIKLNKKWCATADLVYLCRISYRKCLSPIEQLARHIRTSERKHEVKKCDF